MAWSWTYDGDGTRITTGGFPNQAEAEAWLGESWRTLYDAGTRSVTLSDAGREVYTMGLDPA